MNKSTTLPTVVKDRCIAELWEVSDEIIYDADRLFEVASAVAKELKLTVVGKIDHRFTPHGATGGLILAESHFIWHSWPEHNHLSIDMYTCSTDIDLVKAEQVLINNYKPGKMGFSKVLLPEVKDIEN